MSGFKEYILRRIGYTAVTLLAMSVLIFLISQALPGNAARIILGNFATPERIEELERSLGLNQPLYVQYFDWIIGVVTGNFGQSYMLDRPVEQILLPRLIKSLQLALVTLPLIIVVGVPVGVLTAALNDSKFDLLVSCGAYIGVSVPSFVRATLLILLFAGPLIQLFPAQGYVPLREGIVPWLTHLVLPAVALSLGGITHIVRQTRSQMIKTLQTEYVRTARLKGVPEIWVVVKHAVPNGLVPAITVIALQFGWLMGNLVIVETIFGYPGLGRLAVSAVHARDIPVIQATVLIIAAAYMIANFIADIMYTKLDPQIDY